MGVRPGFLVGGVGQGDALGLPPVVAEVVGEAPGEVADQAAFPYLPRGRNAKPVRLLGQLTLARVAGDPSSDLGQLPDLHQEGAPGVIGVGALPEETYGAVQLPEGGHNQVTTGQHIIGEPQPVNPSGERLHSVHTDSPSARDSQQLKQSRVRRQELSQGLGGAQVSPRQRFRLAHGRRLVPDRRSGASMPVR